jgi:hypothetical protein
MTFDARRNLDERDDPGPSLEAGVVVSLVLRFPT